jgi:hypothetical protein
MGFKPSDQHLEEYASLGYTVFRGILPPSLIADLRQATEAGREQARERQGGQTQRFQPIAKFELDERPFEAYRDLPELGEAVRFVLGKTATFGDLNQLGVLLEPAEHSYCTYWHRDWRDNAAYLDYARWREIFADRRYFNQSNCALYEDHSLWVVPGSHLRPDDLERERALFPTRPVPAPNFADLDEAVRERTALEYVTSMPGATQVHLHAGDYALYRNTLWHLGNYVPYARRATLHDFVDTPEFIQFRKDAGADMIRRRNEGHPEWEWSLSA